jgi:hypothetical protein
VECVNTFADFVATGSLLVALVNDAESLLNAPTTLQSKIEKMPSTTDHMPEANGLARESLALKGSLPR